MRTHGCQRCSVRWAAHALTVHEAPCTAWGTAWRDRRKRPCEDTCLLPEQGSYHPCVGQTLCARAACAGSAGDAWGDRHP